METVATTEGLVPLSAKEAVMLGAKSLDAYGKLWFPRAYRQGTPPFHTDIGRILYSPSRLNAFEVFRGGAKTTLLRVFTSQRIAYAISRTIMYVSVSQSHSVFSVRWLKRQIEYNAAWAQTFQLRKGSKWTDEIIEIYHGVDETPITILAMGITGQIRGFNLDDYRPDLIIADDILSEENTATAEQRNKIADLFFGALMNSLAPESDCPNAKLVLLQTPLNKDDVVETCLRDISWHGVRYSVFYEQGNSRWEVRLPTAQLKVDKEAAVRMGRYAIWMREMECAIVHSEQKPFQVSNVQFIDVLPDKIRCLIAIDPASSDSATADDNVVMTVGAHGGNIYVLEYHADKGEMPDATAAHFFQQILKWRPFKAAVEAISFQRVLAWFLEKEMEKRRIFIPIDRVQDRRKKVDRILQALGGVVAYKQLYIYPGMEKLLQQLQDFDPRVDQKDDVIDCLAIGIMALRPYLRDEAFTVDGEARELDEDEYEPAVYTRGCP